jgi:8-oxo-dGTP pyrophosphatase MutT (NUDIX family)
MMLKSRTNQFCNNCGKQGHLFNHCKIPITSIGIICFNKTENMKNKFLMICRKDSIGYIEFLRGKYPLYNRDYIQTLIDEMTINEKNKLLNSDFDELWGELWGEYMGMQYRNEEKHSREKFNQIRRGIKTYDEGSYDLEIIVNESKTNWETPEWGFPKGRRNYQETDITCAYREFIEETGYNKSEIEMITNMQPFEEIFVGSNFKSYKHKYYLAVLKSDNYESCNFQKTEVSDMKWFSLEECIQHIRPYNLEKIDIIKQIDKLLNEYRLIS